MHQHLGEPIRQMAPSPQCASSLRPLLSNLWLGKGATTSPLHYDEYENLLSQVRGTKEILLFPPTDIDRLGYTPRPKGQLLYTWPATFTRVPIDETASASRVIFAASVNLTSPSAEQQRELSQCAPRRCTLSAGETLYLPAFWHHEVRSLPPTAEPAEAAAGGGGLNVAVNFWFRNETAPPPSFD